MIAEALQPYPGLRPFRRDETDIFFGRDRYIDQMTNRLRQHRFLAVTGTSGSGKSSIVKTGLLSALELGLLDEAGGNWRIIDMRPGMRPMEMLARSLLGSLNAAASSHDVEVTRAALERGPKSLSEYLQRFSGGFSDSLLVLVDQFEEIFRFAQGSSAGEAEAFVDLLLGSATQRDVPIYIVLTMRSDFLGDCARFYGLPEMINLGQFLTPRMSRLEYREAIEEPARVCGGAVDSAVTTRLLNDMIDVPDQLCLVQHVMMMMWRRAEARSSDAPRIVLDDYVAVGGLVGMGGRQGALSNHADEVYDALPSDEHRRVAKRMLQRLTEGAGRQTDVRRPSNFKELVDVSGAARDTLLAVIETFRSTQNSFLMPPRSVLIDDDTIIDISHESLIRQWTRLKTWIAEEFDSQEIYKRLEETGRRWKAGKAGLWTEPDLAQALSWREREQPSAAWASRYGRAHAVALEFLEESRRALQVAREEAKRALVWRWVFRGAGVVVPVLLLGLILYLQSVRAQRDETALQNLKIEKQAGEVREWQKRAYKGQFTHLLGKADEKLRAENIDEARAYALAARRLVGEAGETNLDLNDFANIVTDSMLVAQNEQLLANLVATNAVKAVITPDGKHIVWAENGRDKQLIISEAASGRLLSRQSRSADIVRYLIASPDGTHAALLSQSGDAELFLVNGNTQNSYRDVYSPNDLQGIAFGKVGDKLFLAAVDIHGDVWAWRFTADGMSIKRQSLLRRETRLQSGLSNHGFAISCLANQCVWAEPDGTVFAAELGADENDGWRRRGADKIEGWSASDATPPFLCLTASNLYAYSRSRLTIYGIGTADTFRLSQLLQEDASGLAAIGLDPEQDLIFLFRPERDMKGSIVNVHPPLSVEDQGKVKFESKYRRTFNNLDVLDFSPARQSIVYLVQTGVGRAALKRRTYLQSEKSERGCARDCGEIAWLGAWGRLLVGIYRDELHTLPLDAADLSKRPAVASFSPRRGEDIKVVAHSFDVARERILTLVALPSSPAVERERKTSLEGTSDLDIERERKTPLDGSSKLLLAVFDLKSGAFQSDFVSVKSKDDGSVVARTASFALSGTYRDSSGKLESPRVLVAVADNGKIDAVLDPTLKDWRDIRVDGKAGLLRSDGNFIRVEYPDDGKAQSPQRRREIWLASDSGKIVDFGYLDGGTAAFVAYEGGRIDLWSLRDEQSPPVTLEARMKISGLAWSLDQQVVHVHDTNGIKSLTRSGRAVGRYAPSDTVRALVPLADGELLAVVGAHHDILTAVPRPGDDGSMTILAEAATPRWLSRSDHEIASNWTLPATQGAEAAKGGRVEGCRENRDSAMMSAYEEVCSRIQQDPDLSPNLRALAVSEHAYAAVEREWSSDARGAALAFAISRAAVSDPIGIALMARELGKRKEGRLGGGGRSECEGERVTAMRTLYRLALENGRLVVPNHVAAELRCDAEPGPWHANIVDKLRVEAASGNALAYALLGHELERSAQDNPAALRDALVHYGIASRLLLARRDRRSPGAKRLPDQDLIDEIEDVVGARRARLARLLPVASVVDAWALVESQSKAISARTQAGAAVAAVAGYTRMRMLDGLAEADLGARIVSGIQVLNKSTDEKVSRDLTELAVRAQYGLMRHRIAAAVTSGSSEEKFRSATFLDFLGKVSVSTKGEFVRDNVYTIFGPSVRSLVDRLLEKGREDVVSAAVLDQLSDLIAMQAGLATTMSGVKRAELYWELSAAASRLGDDSLAARLAIAMLEVAEDLDGNLPNATVLNRALARVLELVPNAEHAGVFESEFGALGWNYTNWMDDYRNSRLKVDEETISKLIRVGLQVHETYVASRANTSFTQLQRLALAHNFAGLIAARKGDLPTALQHHTRDAELQLTAAAKASKGESREGWRNLDTARSNQADTSLRLGRDHDAVQFSAQRVEAWRSVRESGGADFVKSLFESQREHYGRYVANLDIVEATIGLLSTYRSFAGASGVSAHERKESGRPGSILSRLAQLGGVSIAAAPEPCDRLAAHPTDPLLVGPGVDFDKMDPSAALTACERATERPGAAKRFAYQLARAYLKRDGEGSETAFKALQNLVAAGYPIAFNNFAIAAAKRGSQSQADNYLQYFNRTSHCCAKAATSYLLAQKSGHDSAQIRDAAITFLSWGAQLGSPGGLEELARLVLEGVFSTDVMPSPAAGSPEAFAYYHLRLAERMYREGDSDRRYDRQEDEAGIARSRAMASRLRPGLEASVAADLDAKAANWTFTPFSTAPTWMVPPALSVNTGHPPPTSFKVQAAEEAIAGRARNLNDVLDWRESPQGFDYWDKEDDEVIAGRGLSEEANSILREWVRISRELIGQRQ